MPVASSPHTLKYTLLNFLHHERFAHQSFDEIHALLLTSGLTRDFSAATEIAERLPFSASPVAAAYLAVKNIYRLHHHHPLPFLFNSLISGYARTGSPRCALDVYKRMVGDGVSPAKHSFPLLLKSCTKFSGIWEARQVHCAALKLSYSCDLFVQNALVHVCAMCGEYGDAGQLFDEMPVRDVVSWTGLISGYVKGGLYSAALELFALMDVEPNTATLVSVLVACGKLGDLATGKRIHGLMFKHVDRLGLVVGNALLDMYVKCERLEEARRVFDELLERDIVSWTSIISGLVQCKHPKDAIVFFHEMQGSGVEPDKVVLSSVLSACSSSGALDAGRWVHEYIDRKGIEWDVHIGTAMVDMYAKCGCLETAVQIFHEMPHKNVSSWNALLGALAMHGYGKKALEYFGEMVVAGVKPNEVTFVSILSACSHSGLVEEGRHHFELMTEFYNLMPWIEHYGCLVDLLGRAGLIMEAYELICAMPMKPDLHIWGALLSSCNAYGKMELSKRILSHLLGLEPCDSGVYVLLSNTYAANERWIDVKRVRKLMREKGIKKEAGSSIIELNGEAHEFVVGDFEHHQEEIFQILYSLTKQVQLDCL